MDKKTAFKILNLHHSATFEQAKKAYHNMAKKYHPDVGGGNSESQKDRENRMKEINLAFFFLAPMLESKKKTQRIQRDDHKSGISENSQTPSFPNKLKSLFKAFIKKNHNPNFTNSVKTEKTFEKSKNRQPVFKDILKSVHNGHGFNKIKKRGKYAKRSYNAYQEYMILKKKIKAGQSRTDQGMSIGKVEKINRVRPVSPVGKD